MTRHIFFLIGLAAVAYCFLVDLKTLSPGAIDYAIFAVGFIAMLIYAVQSFVRILRLRAADGNQPPRSKTERPGR